jgi:hypothetical protein
MKKKHAINMRANGRGLSFMTVTSKGNIISAYQGNFLKDFNRQWYCKPGYTHLLVFNNRESFYQDTGCMDLAEKEQ